MEKTDFDREFRRKLQGFEEVAKKKPDDLDSQRRYAWALFGADKIEEAGKVLEQVLRRYPADIEALYALGLTLKRLGESGRAKEIFRKLGQADAPARSENRVRMFRQMAISQVNLLERKGINQ